MKHWQFTEPLLWHGKGFTLSWDFPRAWAVLLHFHNGEQKPWYRRTERNYRFRRWFLKKGKDRFQNIASFQRPEIRLFVFSGFSLLPKKMVIPMEVRILRVSEPEVLPMPPRMKSNPLPVRSRIPQAHVAELPVNPRMPELNFKNIVPPPPVQDHLLAGLRAFQNHQQNQNSPC